MSETKEFFSGMAFGLVFIGCFMGFVIIGTVEKNRDYKQQTRCLELEIGKDKCNQIFKEGE